MLFSYLCEINSISSLKFICEIFLRIKLYIPLLLYKEVFRFYTYFESVWVHRSSMGEFWGVKDIVCFLTLVGIMLIHECAKIDRIVHVQQTTAVYEALSGRALDSLWKRFISETPSTSLVLSALQWVWFSWVLNFESCQ